MTSSATKVAVLSIDGVPRWQWDRLLQSGWMPHLEKLVRSGGPVCTMRSSVPAVSSVAWASYATGTNPGKHGIYGFVDRRLTGDGGLYCPNRDHMRRPDIWQGLSRLGKKVFGMNVPCIYPIRPVNGIMIGGFLAPSLSAATYPQAEAKYLASIDYRLDIDALLCRRSPQRLMGELLAALRARMTAMMHYLQKGPWDFFHVHIMETDRLNHFLIQDFLDQTPAGEKTAEFFRMLDSSINQLARHLPKDTALAILSDHGMCPADYEVNLSQYLVETGYSVPLPSGSSSVGIDPVRSKAFCLIPGRIYVNLRGREVGGIVDPEEYEPLRAALKRDLLAMRDPHGRAVIAKVLMREEAYWPDGAGPVDPAALAGSDAIPYRLGPDLIAIAHEGFDLKMGIGAEIFRRPGLQGMHTSEDAVFWSSGLEYGWGPREIHHVPGLLLRAMGVEPWDGMDLQREANSGPKAAHGIA